MASIPWAESITTSPLCVYPTQSHFVGSPVAVSSHTFVFGEWISLSSACTLLQTNLVWVAETVMHRGQHSRRPVHTDLTVHGIVLAYKRQVKIVLFVCDVSGCCIFLLQGIVWTIPKQSSGTSNLCLPSVRADLPSQRGVSQCPNSLSDSVVRLDRNYTVSHFIGPVQWVLAATDRIIGVSLTVGRGLHADTVCLKHSHPSYHLEKLISSSCHTGEGGGACARVFVLWRFPSLKRSVCSNREMAHKRIKEKKIFFYCYCYCYNVELSRARSSYVRREQELELFLDNRLPPFMVAVYNIVNILSFMLTPLFTEKQVHSIPLAQHL